MRVFEYHCPRFEKMFTPPCPAVAPGTHATERFLERAAQLIRHGDIQNAATFLKAPEKTLERWYYEYVERFHVVKNLQERLTAARKLQLKPLDAFCQTVENWLPMVANYFTNRSSNGPTEGFNRGFRTILWQAFGMTNFRHFRLRILDRFNQPQTQLST
jgi:transposase